MFKRANSLLALTISLLLILCAHPFAKECALDTVKSFAHDHEAHHFGPAVLGSTAANICLTPKERYNSFDEYFHDALIPDQALINSTQPLFSTLFNASVCFDSKIWLDATDTRAPPAFS